MATMVSNVDADHGAVREVTIAPDGDFVIRLTPPVAKPLVEPLVKRPVASHHTFEFRVSRAVLSTHSAFFHDLFGVQPTLSIVTIENYNISRSLEIWLRGFQEGADSIPLSLIADRSERVWDAIAVSQRFGFAPRHAIVLRPWFLAHYEHELNNGPGLTHKVARRLALPCAFFEHAGGFMKLTKYLVYNTNTSLFTDSYQTIGVDSRSLDGPLTAAKAHVQSTLEQELSFPLKKLHEANCVCRKETAFDYEHALIVVGCWPINVVAHKSTLFELFEKLSLVKFQPVVTSCESGECRRNFKRSVENAVIRAKQCFQGLCLDCMHRSKPVVGQSHGEYIKKNSPHVGCWDMECRFGHGRPSWFFSWMGSSSNRTHILNNYRHGSQNVREGSGATTSGRIQQSMRAPVIPSHGTHIHTGRHATTLGRSPGFSQGALRAVSDSSNKENFHHDHTEGNFDVVDNEELFDAEEVTYLDRLVSDEVFNG